MAIGERDWDDPGQLDNLVRLFRTGRHEALAAPLRFFVPTPMHPGDPLQVSCLAQSPIDDGWVEVSVGGHLLETLHLPALVAGGPGRVRPPSGSAAARALYEVGPKRLTFKASGSYGATCQQLPVEVAAPDLASWWVWRWPAPAQSCYWRCAYRLGGELTNLGTAGVRVERAAFEERCHDGTGRWLDAVRVSSAELPPQSAATVTSELRQEWQWTSWSPLPGGEDYVRRFDYELSLAVEDEFGNRYHLRSRLPQPVPVLISPRKRNWWRAEAALRGAGIALLVRAASAPADVAGDLAQRIFGAGALRGRRGIADRVHDLVIGPPSPDPEFGVRVSWPRRLAVEEVVSGELSWPDRLMVEALVTMEYLADLHEAITEVEARWLGARMADDAEAMRNQRADLLDLLRLTFEEWARASYRVADLRSAPLEGEDEVPYRLVEWQAAGVPASILDDWEHRGIPGRWIEDVLVAGGEMLWTAEGVVGYVRRALEAALFATRDLLTANPEIAPSPDRAQA